MTGTKETDRSHVWVGPAGWSYDDWEGIVYEKGLGAARLEAVARLFSTVEINSTFYRSPAPKVAESWAERVAGHPRFRFTAKLVRLFTHEDPGAWTLKGRDDFRDGLEPLRERGLLGAILVQFPWFYEATEPNLHRLSRIRKAFPEHRLVLEVRHRSWLAERCLEEVSNLGYSFCNADLPMARTSIPLDHVVTGPVGYLRLHGRNAEKWFRKDAAVHEKYDYLYGPQELEKLLDTAECIRERTEELYVVANNHFAGKGPANALEIQARLCKTVPAMPETLLETYPRLRRLPA